MKTSTIGRRLDRWLDECKMALSGISIAMHYKRFWLAFCLTVIIFGTLMNLLSGSFAGWNLFWATDFAGKIQILGSAFLGIFGVGRSFQDFLLTLVIILLQSLLIGLIVIIWQEKRHNKTLKEAQNFHNASDAGLAAGLAILGSGCPTCGTTLLMPVISTFVSSGGYLLAGIISGVLTVAAVLLSCFALKRIGREVYISRLCQKYQQKSSTNSQKTVNSPQKGAKNV